MTPFPSLALVPAAVAISNVKFLHPCSAFAFPRTAWDLRVGVAAPPRNNRRRLDGGGQMFLFAAEENSADVADEVDANIAAESSQRALLAARLDIDQRAGKGRDGILGRRRPAEPHPPVSSVSVGIVGAGSVAFGTAAFLSAAGHNPMLWSPSGGGTADLLPFPSSADDGSSSPSPPAPRLTSTGALEAEVVTPRIAGSAEDLVLNNDVVLVALPAYGYRAAFDAVAPHVRPGQHVIISSQASLGALYLRRLLSERNVEAPVTAWGTTAVLARRTSGTEVNVIAVRKLIDMCTVPSDRSEEGLAMCRRLFGDDRFKVRDGLLAISLSNLNPQNHMGIALGNMSRMERGEKWSQGQNVTPNIGRLLEELDQERLNIADALGLDVRTIFDHFHLSFHVPIASISEMNQMMHEQGNGATGPDTGNSRYVTEDVPYGLALTVALGELTGRPAVLHEAGIRIFSAMYGRDFAAENELLSELNLSHYSLDELRDAANSGLLPHCVKSVKRRVQSGEQRMAS